MSEEKSKNSAETDVNKAGFVRQWAFSYNPRENKLVAILRSWFRVFFIIVHEFSETAISLRASALTYTIVLSMVPMLAMSTALLKAWGSDTQLRMIAYRYIDQLEPEKQETQPLPEKNSSRKESVPESMDIQTSEPDGDVGHPVNQNQPLQCPAGPARLR